jgi:photosystem II stability/assembly factor-like uncharacterized protein
VPSPGRRLSLGVALAAITFAAIAAPGRDALAGAAAGATSAPAPSPEATPSMLGSLSWRNIGPARGGRAQAVAGVIGDRNTYYMGATGGGVWKTTDAGGTWTNVTDGFVGTGSVGDVQVAPSDPNVVWVGMGEADIRGNFSHGDGVYRSTDAGRTWAHVGLEDSRQIGRIAVHPDDPDTAFVAALGHVFGPNAQRGVFRTTDGGETWERVLFVDDRTGAVDVRIDPINPRVVYAGLWQVSRTPWRLDSGGPGSGLYRSTDGGSTWTELTNGLPAGVKGKISVSPSRAQRDLVYAMVEAEDGGVFRSTDGGDSWRRVNDDRSLRQRAWYYTHVYADPVDPDTVYVMNVRFHKSTDGGERFSTIRVPHADNHDLWIDPHDNQRLVNANDGGANVSFDGGGTWSTQTNQPTAQFYRVTTDSRVPYRVYGAQQDNSTASVSSTASAGGNWQRDLYAVGGGESGYIAVHPENPDIVYAGSYGGYLTRYDHATGTSRNVMVWPENPMGAGTVDLVHRFQWTFPIVISPHDPETVYVGGERLFVTRDGGASFEAISPDLTTDDPSKQRSSGGPITQDNTSVEYYCTIFTVAESPLEAGLIWVGSDDGLVHLTEDGGGSWTNITPPDMGDWPMISLIEASPHDADTAWMAVNRYKMNDFRPQVWRTRDRGANWELVVDGIAGDAFVRSVREDPVVPGLLYAGTETGVWASLDGGDSWMSLQLDLPVTPVTDVTVRDDDLVIATQGRSFWILDDLVVLRAMAAGMGDPARPQLVDPAPAYRQGWDSGRFHVWRPAGHDGELELVVRDAASGRVIRELEVPAEAGMHLVRWNFRHEDPVRVPGAVAWPPHPPGPRAKPGAYAVDLVASGADDGEQIVAAADFELRGHPGVPTTADEYAAQEALLLEIHARLSDAHRAVNEIRGVRRQVDAVLEQAAAAGRGDAIAEAADTLLAELSEVEEAIIQTRSRSPQDPLNFPIKLNDKIGALAYVVDGDFGPTRQARAAFEDLSARLQVHLDRLDVVRAERVDAFNALVADAGVPAIVPPADDDDA